MSARFTIKKPRYGVGAFLKNDYKQITIPVGTECVGPDNLINGPFGDKYVVSCILNGDTYTGISLYTDDPDAFTKLTNMPQGGGRRRKTKKTRKNRRRRTVRS
jgi:hypothetical protein